jgi:hypothetical protein
MTQTRADSKQWLYCTEDDMRRLAGLSTDGTHLAISASHCEASLQHATDSWGRLHVTATGSVRAKLHVRML